MSLLEVQPDEKTVSSATKKPVKYRRKNHKKWGDQMGVDAFLKTPNSFFSEK
jgi:hypothetical protein